MQKQSKRKLFTGKTNSYKELICFCDFYYIELESKIKKSKEKEIIALVSEE